MALKRPYQCNKCNRLGTHAEVLAGTFKHSPSCSIGKMERGERCPDCGSANLCCETGNDLSYGCRDCGQRWDTETFMDCYTDRSM